MAAEIGIKIGVDGANQASTQLAGVNKSLGDLGRASDLAKNALAAIGVGVSVAGFTAWIKGAIDAADAANDIAERTGLAIQEIAGLQLAFKMGDVDAQALTSTMSKLSKSVVENADAFARIGVNTKTVDGSFRSTREILGDVADKFASYEDGVGKAALAQELFGKSGAELIPVLNQGAAGLAEMDAMAAKLGLTLDKETARQAQKFNDVIGLIGAGTQGIATRIAADLLPTLSGLAEEFFNSATSGDNLKKVAEGLSVALRGLYIAGRLAVETLVSIIKTANAVGSSIAAIASGDFGAVAIIARDLRKELATGWTDALGDVERAWNTTGSKAIETLGQMSRETKKQKPPVKELKDSVKELGDEFAAQRDAAKDWAKAIEDFRKIAADATAATDGLSKGQARLIEYLQSPAYQQASEPMRELALQEAYAAIAAEQNADAQAKATKAIEDRIKATVDSADAAEKSVAQMLLEEQASLLAADARISEEEAVQRVTIAKLKETEAMLAADPARERELEAIRREIVARETLAGAINRKDTRDAAKKAAEDATAEWKKASENVERALTDALMRGFESGKGFAQNLKDTVVNLFKTMVLRPVIQAIVQPVANGLTSALGIPSMGGGSSISGGAGWLGSIGSSFGSFGTAFANGSNLTLGTAWDASMGMFETGSYASGMGTLAGAAAPYLGYAAALYSLSEGNYATAALTALGTYIAGPIGAAIGSALGGLFDGPRNSSKEGGESIIDVTAGTVSVSAQTIDGARLLYTPSTDDSFADALARGASSGLTAALTQFGGSIGSYTLGIGFDRDAEGKASGRVSSFFSTSAGDVMRNTNIDYGTDPQALNAGLSLEVQRLIIAGLQKSDLPVMIRQYFDDIDPATLTQEQINGIMAAATAMDNLLDAATSLGVPLESVTQTMLDAAGGVDKLSAGIASYYANFYTEEEKRARGLADLEDDFAKLGVSVPKTREEFRALVESLDLTTDWGQAQYGFLMMLAPGFASLVPASEGAVDAVDNVETALRKLEGLDLADLYDQVGLGDKARELRRATLAGNEDLAQVFEDLGVGLPTTAAGLRAIVEAASPEQAAVLGDYADALIASLDPVEAAAERLEGVGLADLYDQVGLTAEAAAIRADDMKTALEAVGLTVPTTSDALKEMVKSASPEQAAVLMRYAGQLVSLTTTVEDSSETLEQALLRMRNASRSVTDIAGNILTMERRAAQLEVSLAFATGDPTAAAQQRALDTAGMTPEEIVLYDRIQVLEGQLDAATAPKASSGQADDRASRVAAKQQEEQARQQAIDGEREGLQRELLQLQGKTAELRRLEREELDESNRALYDRVQALRDEQVVTNERKGLERRLLELQGDTAAIRALELEKLDPSNRALQERIWALEDEQKATNEARAAAERLRDSWRSVSDSIADEVARIRGIAADGSASFGELQSRFAITTAQARAGDVEAGKSLSEIARQLTDAGVAQAGSTLEAAQIRAQVADSLETTRRLIDSAFVADPAPTTYAPAVEPAEPLANLSTAIDGLRTDAQAQATATTTLQLRVTRIIERWDADGIPSTRVEA